MRSQRISSIRRPPSLVHNRVLAVMVHIPWYTVQGISRLARDSDLGKSTVWELVQGNGFPPYATLLKVSRALSRRHGKPIPVEEIAILAGEAFKTKYPCELMSCRGCLPPWAWTDDDWLRPAFGTLQSGRWTQIGPPDFTSDN